MRKLLNRRIPLESSMPPLAEACGTFKHFTPGEKRSDRIFEMLLVVIQRCRGSTPKRFYTMRDVAAFFGVALCTVERAYTRLTLEGLLTRIRSSQTMIAARTLRPRLAVRGVVCMPIYMPGFIWFTDWRNLFSQLEEELSRYRFILEPIFYKGGEEIDHAFVDRVLRFNPDYVLWHFPANTRAEITTMLSMADAGVRLVVIQPQGEAFPGRTYNISHGRALRRGLEEWAASGEVDNIVVPQGGYPDTEVIESVLQDCSLPHRLKRYRTEKAYSKNFFEELAPDRRTGIIFDDDILYTRICALMPEVMLRILRQRRVMVRRRVTIPSVELPGDVTVDAILFPWKRLASQIAMDLSKGKGPLPSGPAVFEAEWHSRIPLARVVQGSVQE